MDIEGESVTFSENTTYDRPPDIRLIHYNDVYHVYGSSSEPVGGVARFQTLCNYYRDDPKFAGQPKPVTVFSGDAFNPSLESSVTKGSHMVPLLNAIGTDVACVGNHDLDFGVRQYRHLTGQCTFPWLLANILDPALGENVPIGNAQRTTMITASNGIKIGVIGLGEREWLATINSIPPNLIYQSVSETAKELVPELKRQGADIIIAVTHQREPNDNKLAEKTGNSVIDIILGGHDHYYNHSFINGTHVLRSGSDFKQLSYIEGWRRTDHSHGWHFKITRRDVVSSIEEDEKAMAQIQNLNEALKSRLEKPIGYTATPLDARFSTVRTKESNMGNFVCDLMRFYYDSECCIMAAGTIRGDQIYPPGILKMKDILNCFPFEDPVVVIRVTGKALLGALENSVSQYPALEGRFPQVSNISFEFDPKAPSRSRVKDVKVCGEPIDLQRKYKLSTRGYMARGKDGYDALLVQSEGGEAEEIVNEENGVLISTILRQYFMSLKVLGKWKKWGPSMGRHWGTVQSGMDKSHPVLEPKRQAETLEEQTNQGREDTAHVESDDEDDHASTVSEKSRQRDHELSLMRWVIRRWWRAAGLPGQPQTGEDQAHDNIDVHWAKAISPRLEKRIRITGQSAE